MRQIHRGHLFCWILILVWVAPIGVSAQTSKSQDDASVTKSTSSENKKILAIASQVNRRHDRNAPGSDNGTKLGYISTLQLLSASLNSLKDNDKVIVLAAIRNLTQDSIVEACTQVIKNHETRQMPDEDWINTLWYSAELLPSHMNELFLSSLEKWEEKHPYHVTKSPPKTMFHSSVVRRMSTDFQELASQSQNSVIASTAFDALVDRNDEYWSVLESFANRILASKKPVHRAYGIKLFSRLNPAWKGHQSRLKQLTDDPDKSVSRAAIGAWLHNPLPNDRRRLLEALSADSDIEKVVALNQLDTKVIADWGSKWPVTNLVSSGSKVVQMAAIRTISRTHPRIVKPLTDAIKNDPSQNIRQFALDQVQLRGWTRTGNNDYDWNRINLGDADAYFALLADAARDGLEIEDAMLQLTTPFGYHPQLIYENLESGQLHEGQKLEAIAQLLDSDPSLKATETAIGSLREIISENQTKNKKGYLGQSSTSWKLITGHAKRLAPIVPELCSFIEQTQSTRLVGTLSSFGVHAKPSIGLLINILEDDTGKWKDSRRHAIFAIRAMQQHGISAVDSLLKVAQENDSKTSLIAALTYLDLGGDPAALMPTYASSLPVLAKVDRTVLITIPEFRTAIEDRVASGFSWNLLRWLGPRAEFLLPAIKLKFAQLQSRSSETNKLIELIPMFESAQKEFLPICIEYLENRPMIALNTISKIGDDQRLAENAVKSLMNSSTKYIRRAAKSCYEKIYKEQKD